MTLTRHELEQAIAKDLEICEIGMALYKPGSKPYQKYERHRRLCLDQLKQCSPVSPESAAMSDEELLRDLGVEI